ncbi:hypothetical protein SSOG_08609 [Streptomyces himastatinicus ATCC 53653]|uniref:Uncharacterized protein n=1 Tax=Streptomyces himastatinicus ATCC 53653 TaxID=457427 RepID=D9WFD7_9ACTN|nr:hypothetical protein [Streptomyces himastatinicus]EFL28895.1 hypothetical protein SSOG_08609 [Streptomyces himastatinicus ATCC 53653]
MIRFFVLDGPARRALISFEAQSPTGEGCAVTFDEVRFTQDLLTNVRHTQVRPTNLATSAIVPGILVAHG